VQLVAIPTASATASPATAAAVTPPTVTASATTSALTRPRFIHNDVAAHEVLTIERLDCASCLLIVLHFYEAETSKLSRHLIANQVDTGSRNPGLGEPVDDVLLSRLKRQVPYIQFFHNGLLWDV
jgi:hypothetical protein